MAMKAGEAIRVSTLRLLSNAIHNEEISKQRELTQEEEIALVRRQLKQREEAAEAYMRGGRSELAEKEKQEAEILKSFLPAQMTEQEIEQIVERIKTRVRAMTTDSADMERRQDFGRVMGAVVKEIAGRADGRTVAEVVKRKLTVNN